MISFEVFRANFFFISTINFPVKEKSTNLEKKVSFQFLSSIELAQHLEWVHVESVRSLAAHCSMIRRVDWLDDVHLCDVHGHRDYPDYKQLRHFPSLNKK